MTPQETCEFVSELRATLREIELLPMPTVAVIDGAIWNQADICTPSALRYYALHGLIN